MESRFELVRGGEEDFNEDEEEAEGGEGDDYAEGCAIGGSDKSLVWGSGVLFLVDEGFYGGEVEGC